jgi:hypothetical protein
MQDGVPTTSRGPTPGGGVSAVGVAGPAEEADDSLEHRLLELASSGALAGAGREAIRAQVERGIPVTFLRGEQVIKRHADGREEVLGAVPRRTFVPPGGVHVIDNGK